MVALPVIALLSTPIDERTTPAELERIRRNLVDVARELQGQRVLRVVKEDLVLADGVATPIAHGLGRRAFVLLSPVRGATATGRIEEIRDGSHDSTKFAVLKATGFGGPVTVDVGFA